MLLNFTTNAEERFELISRAAELGQCLLFTGKTALLREWNVSRSLIKCILLMEIDITKYHDYCNPKAKDNIYTSAWVQFHPHDWWFQYVQLWRDFKI